MGGEEHSTTFEVLKDPNTAGTEADIGSQVDFLYAIKADMEAGAEAVHQLEALRVQLQTVARFSEDSEVVDAAEALEEKVTALEMEWVDLRLTGQGQDAVRFEAKLLSKLSYLTRALSGGDFRPTDQEMEVREILHGQVGEQVNALEALVAQDVAAFNGFLREKGVGIIGG